MGDRAALETGGLGVFLACHCTLSTLGWIGFSDKPLVSSSQKDKVVEVEDIQGVWGSGVP